MDEETLKAQRDAQNRRKLEEHLANIRRHGGVPPQEQRRQEEATFQRDWEQWKRVWGGRVIHLDRGEADPDADYRLLGLKRGASRDDIRRAYYRLAKQHHPDRGGNVDRFLALMQAFQRLHGK
ncbi:MAG: J domain-containing protein [Candidatus Lambdaproteobacteria bacterium]|nr:J domain-containing protein [Candidatus Lambdaproteobacteria bacterium]